MSGLDDQFGYGGGEKDRRGDDKYGGGNFGGEGSMTLVDDKVSAL